VARLATVDLAITWEGRDGDSVHSQLASPNELTAVVPMGVGIGKVSQDWHD